MPCELARPARRFASVVAATAVLGATTAACGAAASGAGRASTAAQSATTAQSAATAHAATVASAHRPSPGLAGGPEPAPRFFIDDVLFSGAGSGGLAQVRLAATGSLVTQPADGQVLSVAPLGSRSFVIARLTGTCNTELVKAGLTVHGRLGRLVRFGPLLPGEVVSMTADADATAIGFGVWNCSKSVSGYLGVLDLRTGAVRRWGSVSVAGSRGSFGLGEGLSMSANGGLLAFTGASLTPGGLVASQQVRVLTTASRAGELADRSRVVLRAPATGPAIDAVLLSPGGKSFYLCTVNSSPVLRSSVVTAHRTTDGRQTKTIARLTAHGSTAGELPLGCPMAADPSGTQLLVPYSLRPASAPGVGPAVGVARIDVATGLIGRISFRLPGSAGMSTADGVAVAW
jgi:hypothetical protein